MSNIKVGDIAMDAKGCLGLILKIKTQTNLNEPIYEGIHLGLTNLGKKWKSTDPNITNNIHDLLNVTVRFLLPQNYPSYFLPQIPATNRDDWSEPPFKITCTDDDTIPKEHTCCKETNKTDALSTSCEHRNIASF